MLQQQDAESLRNEVDFSTFPSVNNRNQLDCNPKNPICRKLSSFYLGQRLELNFPHLEKFQIMLDNGIVRNTKKGNHKGNQVFTLSLN